jgi:hypothetical protein
MSESSPPPEPFPPLGDAPARRAPDQSSNRPLGCGVAAWPLVGWSAVPLVAGTPLVPLVPLVPLAPLIAAAPV